MRLSESMRNWRWRGSTGAFRVSVSALLLGLSLAQSVSPNNECPAVLASQSLSQPQYQDTADDESTAGFMAALVQFFLHTVQPNPFPQDLILKLKQDIEHAQSNQGTIKETLVYEVGFLVCAAIGVLYIVLIPIVGLFLVCCRCCGNCGGKMYQKQTSSIHCRRRTLYWSAFITTVIILAGNICMFKSNVDLEVSIDRSKVELNKTIDNINTFLTAVPQQLNFVVNESYRTVEEVTTNLDAIGPQLGAEIQRQFAGTLDLALHSVRLLDQETVSVDVQLKKVNSSLSQLQSSLDLLQANLTAVKNRINQTLSKPNCNNCNLLQPELQRLTLDISTPCSNEIQSAVDDVSQANLKSQIKEVEDFFQSIPQRVTNDTMDIVQKSKLQLDDIKAQISQVTDEIPLSFLTDMMETLDRVRREISMATPQVEQAELIRWGVSLLICCVVLLVVVCNLLGLFLGPLGLKSKADPTERSCTADCGGTFLMMGAGLSFLFSWIFMIIVLLLFLLGGHSYTLLCQPWNNGQLLKFIDTSGLIPEIGPTLGLKTNINISDIYSNCEENQPLWTTLHLFEIINLEELLNVSKYAEQIQQDFDDVQITLSPITVLSSEDKELLTSFSHTTQNFDFAANTQLMNNMSSINLNTTADKIDEFAGYQTNADIQKELQNEANDLRQIQANIETTITPQLENLNSTLKSLQSAVEKINKTVGEVLSNVEAAQDFLNTNTTLIIKTEAKRFVDCQLDYFFVYAELAKITITQKVGRCGPVAGSVDSAEMILCSQVVESLNAYWFSLGWCLIFFIPSIIFSVKLAKYYRRMKYSDVYDEPIPMSHIPRAWTKFA